MQREKLREPKHDGQHETDSNVQPAADAVVSTGGTLDYAGQSESVASDRGHSQNGRRGPHISMGSKSISSIDGVVGSSDPIKHLCQLVHKAADAIAPVLISGETGTGKNLIAVALHRLSRRASAPLLTVNCAAKTEAELEAELFRCLLAASGGSVFIDEIDALPVRLQVRLLHAIEQHGFESGHGENSHGETGNNDDSRYVEIDVRFITASNMDLGAAVSDGAFREDLLWRLNVIPVAMPPLRRRPADVALLVRHFLNEYSSQTGKAIDRIHPDAMRALEAYHWPGNITEMQNYIHRAVALADGDELITDLLPKTVMGDVAAAQDAVFRPTDEASLIREFVYSRIAKAPADTNDLHKQIVDPVEKELLVQVLESVNQTQTKAAAKLGLNRNTVFKKMKAFGLDKATTESESQKE